MSQEKEKPSASEKYSKSRMFEFEGYEKNTIILQADEVPFDCDFLVYKLKCKKCDKMLVVDNGKKEEIRCCKKKKEKKPLNEEEKIFNAVFNALTIGLDKEEKKELKNDENIKNKIIRMQENFVRENVEQ